MKILNLCNSIRKCNNLKKTLKNSDLDENLFPKPFEYDFYN